MWLYSILCIVLLLILCHECHDAYDIDECAEGTHRCGQHQNCINTDYGYKCQCKSGYGLDYMTGACVDINECTTGQHGCIDHSERCDNTIGSYLCIRTKPCGTGYIMHPFTSKCEDIDECATGTHNCARAGPQYYCENIPGFFRCVRRRTSTTSTTLSLDYKYYDSEEEITEVIQTTSESTPRNTQKPASTQTTINLPTITTTTTIFPITNSKKPTTLSTTIEAVTQSTSEIKSNDTIDIVPSKKKDASHSNFNFVPKGDKSDITNIPKLFPEINMGKYEPKPNENEETEILNTIGPIPPQVEITDTNLYTPSSSENKDTKDVPKDLWRNINVPFICPPGFKIDEYGACFDIDECSTEEAKHCPVQICRNLLGGYSCSCPEGHKLVGDHDCQDVDECALAGKMLICAHNADCVNTIGSYQCRCHKGFRSAVMNDKVCVNVDECTESRPGTLCQDRCIDIWGGYRCSCHRGYRLNPDNSTCSDVDECLELKSKNPCVGHCLNEPGSYRCACPPGYKLAEDKINCIDIDECSTGEATCAKNGVFDNTSHICVNTRGSYKCLNITCPSGYQLEGKLRCNIVDRKCWTGDWNCIHHPTTISYNFITFNSKLYIPAGKVKLFTMRGPSWAQAKIKFQLRLVDVNAPPSVRDKADSDAFLLQQYYNEEVVSLVRPLEGPQSIELELSMEVYNANEFVGIAIARLYIYVSEYEF